MSRSARIASQSAFSPSLKSAAASSISSHARTHACTHARTLILPYFPPYFPFRAAQLDEYGVNAMLWKLSLSVHSHRRKLAPVLARQLYRRAHVLEVSVCVHSGRVSIFKEDMYPL